MQRRMALDTITTIIMVYMMSRCAAGASSDSFSSEEFVSQLSAFGNGGGGASETDDGWSYFSAETASKAIFILGDSSVDCGENSLFYSLIHRNLSLFPCDGSDSILIPHLLAKKMGLPQIPSFYNQNGSIQGLLTGLNFGSAQATIMFDPIYTPTFQSLSQQLRQAFETIQILDLNLGLTTSRRFIESSIFFLSFGKDDFIRFFFPHHHNYNKNSPSGFHTDPHIFIHVLVDQMIQAIVDLYDAGVRRIVYAGLLPLGCAPRSVLEWYFVTGKENETKGCVAELNWAVMEFNKKMRERILDLKIDLPDARIVFCDIYAGMMQIISDPVRYGFEKKKSACCGAGWHGAATGCFSVELACNNPNSHIWWDLYNPTRAVNLVLADSVWSGSQPVADLCHPMTIHDLANVPHL